MNITDKKRKDKEEKSPKRGGEDFKVIFDEACRQVRESPGKAGDTGEDT